MLDPLELVSTLVLMTPSPSSSSSAAWERHQASAFERCPPRVLSFLLAMSLLVENKICGDTVGVGVGNISAGIPWILGSLIVGPRAG
jgi:hypothetical protein